MAVRAFAPAKINLYLHVVGRRPDGYHLLDSLVAFADIGDWVTAGPADRLSLVVHGPEAGSLPQLGEDNLVLRAARLLAAEIAARAPNMASRGAALLLEKHLPESSGIGGGSSDAAAALRALSRLWPHPLDAAALGALSLRLGADTPACLAGRAVWVSGIGERIEPATGLPAAGIVLVNPRRKLPTPSVFQARRGAFGEPGRFAAMPHDPQSLAAALETRRNDLTEAALSLAPEIAQVLDHLGRLPGALLSRMSGSGATCFALFADREAAENAVQLLANSQPGWWSAAGRLLAEPPAVEEGPAAQPCG